MQYKLGNLFTGLAKRVAGIGQKGTKAAFSKARQAPVGSFKRKSYTVAGKASGIARKHPEKALAGAGGAVLGAGGGYMLAGNEKRAEHEEVKKVVAEAKREGEDPQVEGAEHLIKGEAKVNEVLPHVDKDKRDDVLKELREDKGEKKEAAIEHYPNMMEKTASVETKIGEGIGWQ